MKYSDIRPNIRTGDCILWKGDSWVSRQILRFSAYSHVSLVVRLDKYSAMADRVFLVEALGNGIVFRLLSERMKDYNGRVFFFGVNLLQHQRDDIRDSSLLNVTRNVKYDYKSLFRNLAGRVNMDADKYICSEYVWAEWLNVNFVKPFKPTKRHPQGKAPTPGDLPNWARGQEIVRIEL